MPKFNIWLNQIQIVLPEDDLTNIKQPMGRFIGTFFIN
jgi:hypothetical protein